MASKHSDSHVYIQLYVHVQHLLVCALRPAAAASPGRHVVVLPLVLLAGQRIASKLHRASERMQ
jgi:hypothetical protein